MRDSPVRRGTTRPVPRRGAWVGAMLLGVLVGGCGPNAAEQWSSALAAQEAGDPRAFDQWQAIPTDTPEGRHARGLLRRADEHYRRGIALLAGAEFDGEADEAEAEAAEALRRGLELGPMNPGYYPTVGRLFHERGRDVGAARVYARYLRARPAADDSPAVRRALRDLDPSSDALIAIEAGRDVADTRATGPLGVWAGILLGLLLAGGLVFAWNSFTTRGVGLRRLIVERPELHPAIAYLVGSLRHELLKHRVGAAGDAVALLASGRQSVTQVEFIQRRLLGGEPLERAFAGYVRAFERALGHQFEARRDAGFRAAGRAMRDITRIASNLGDPSHRDVKRLGRAHETLTAFDRSLKVLVDGLVRTRVDEALFRQVADEVTGEYAASRVSLDELRIEPFGHDEPVHVEVFRVDLLVVLKNLVRNAILAAGRGEQGARVAIRLDTELEVTGEETVLISVADTSNEVLTVEMIRDREFGRGLGLVAAAVSRYGGAIAVHDGPGDFAKSVVVSFSRAFADETGEVESQP